MTSHEDRLQFAPEADPAPVDAYAPTSFLHVGGTYFEDLRFPLRLWIAAFGMFLFLREPRLRSTSAIMGALVYCLSGAFTLSIQLNWIESTMLTPFLLLFSERSLRIQSLRSVLPLGGVLALSFLSAHLETIVLQYVFLWLHVAFRTVQVHVARRQGIGVGVRNLLSPAAPSSLRSLLPE